MYQRFALLAVLSVATLGRTVFAVENEAVYPDDQPVLSSSNGELSVTLTLGETMYENPVSGLKQKVVGYNGFLGGPTLRVKPGDVLRITLKNELPEESCNTSVPEMWNKYHAIYDTNLHAHGLFIPSKENPVHEKIHPGKSYEYTINVPETHQGGTHWYHPHVSGSTTLQAGGGALGFLIVEDHEGDLPDEVSTLPEVLMRIQFFNFTYLQWDYATGTDGSYVELCRQFCLPAEKRPNCSEYFFEKGPEAGAYNTTISPDGLEFETLTINGIERPTIQMTAGQWYRFRTVYVPTRFRTIEPAIEGCDFKLLAKDGKYIPVAPRDIASAYMFSGSRADFLVRCKDPGTYEFNSLSEVLDSSNWIASQKRPSLKRTMALLQVEAAVQAAADPLPVSEIPKFKVARPCYLPDMRDTEPDSSFYFIQSGLTPPLPKDEILPDPRPAWETKNISYYAINNEGAHAPPSIEYLGPSPLDFELMIGSVVEIDYFAPQIHPLHMHIFAFQVVELPQFDGKNDYFQVGDYHDVLIVPIGNEYAKAVMRSHIAQYKTEVLVHCHFYRHSDRGMAILGHTVGEEGALSDKVGKCYTGLTDRGFELVTQEQGDGIEGEGEPAPFLPIPDNGAESTSFASSLRLTKSHALTLFVAMLSAVAGVVA